VRLGRGLRSEQISREHSASSGRGAPSERLGRDTRRRQGPQQTVQQHKETRSRRNAYITFHFISIYLSIKQELEYKTYKYKMMDYQA